MRSTNFIKSKQILRKRAWRKAIVIAAGAGLACCVAGFAWPRASIAEAENLLKAGRTEQAVSMLTALESRNDTVAAKRLGTLYWHGEGVLRDREKAIPYLECAAFAGDVQANALLGTYYGDDANGDTSNRIKAEQYLLAAAEGGHAESCAALGRMYYDDGGAMRTLAVPYLAKAADSHIPEAAALYGSMLLRGDGVRKEYRLGNEYLNAAAQADDPDIDFLIGTAYLEANIPDKALPFLTRAHDGGRRDAGYAIGSILLSRLEPDYAAAAHYLKPLADEGHEGACTFLADLAYDGKGIGKDRAAAYRYLQPAVRAGTPRAMARAGFMLAVGEGVARDVGRGLSLLKAAGGDGHSGALVGLGALHYFEKYGMQNRPRALEYWRQAAALGDSRGMDLLQEDDVVTTQVVHSSASPVLLEEMARLRETVQKLEETNRDMREAAATNHAVQERRAAQEKARQVVEQEMIRQHQSLERVQMVNQDKEQVNRVYGSSFDMGAQARMATERNTREQTRADKLVDSIASSISSERHVRRRNWHHGYGSSTPIWTYSRPVARDDYEEIVKPSLPSRPQAAPAAPVVKKSMKAIPKIANRTNEVKRK